jgi:hypothetical protein
LILSLHEEQHHKKKIFSVWSDPRRRSLLVAKPLSFLPSMVSTETQDKFNSRSSPPLKRDNRSGVPIELELTLEEPSCSLKDPKTN